MSMSPNRGDREYQKFVETADGNAAVRVTSIGEMLSGISYDSILASYPTDSSEVYSYYNNGLSGDLVATVTVVYTDSTKNVLTSVVRT